MAETSRDDHMAWCKSRALEYLDRGDAKNALASFTSDLRKHPETDDLVNTDLIVVFGFPLVIADDVDGLRRFIEGFE